MNRIGLLMAIMVLAIGCSSTTVVDNDKSNETGEKPATNELASTADVPEETTDDTGNDSVADADVANEEAPDALEEDADSSSEADSPRAMLDELKSQVAKPAKFFEFADLHKGTDLGFEALTSLAQRPGLKKDITTQLVAKIKSDYLLSDEATDSQALTSSMLLMDMGDAKERDATAELAIERFVASQEKLGRNTSRVISLLMRRGSEEAKQKLSDVILENFANDDGLVSYVQQLARAIPSANNVAFLKTLMEKSTSDSIKGYSMMTLAQLYSSMPDAKAYVANPGVSQQLPKSSLEFINDFDVDAHADEIEMLLTKVKEDYGEIKGRRGSLGDMAENELFVIQNLSIGKTAPDIVGEDLDGEEFKLSDYRGKVIMLDFWGDW